MIVTDDGEALLLGRFTGMRLWDIPKGMADPGEPFDIAAARELREETGLEVAPHQLLPLGVKPYRPRKDLALFLWRVPAMPAEATLVCRSMFRARDGRDLPEFDAFAILPWAEAVGRVGRAMASRLTDLRREPVWPFRS